MEQGIFHTYQGKFFKEQGIFIARCPDASILNFEQPQGWN
jgi:hypothetical protein